LTVTSKPNRTVDLGLKDPCQCGSGKRFKACCYQLPRKGSGWLFLSARTYLPLRIEIPGHDHPALLLHATYKGALEYSGHNKLVALAGEELYLVRMTIEQVTEQLDASFRPGDTTLLIVPATISEDGQGAVYEVVSE